RIVCVTSACVCAAAQYSRPRIGSIDAHRVANGAQSSRTVPVGSRTVVKCSITTRCRSFPMFTPLHRFRILQAEKRTGAALLSIESRAGGPWWSSGPQSAPGFHKSEEHTSELQSRENLVCRLLLEKKK